MLIHFFLKECCPVIKVLLLNFLLSCIGFFENFVENSENFEF